MCCLCLLEIYMTLILEILSVITDVHHQTGLLLVCTQVLQTKTEEETNLWAGAWTPSAQ